MEYGRAPKTPSSNSPIVVDLQRELIVYHADYNDPKDSHWLNPSSKRRAQRRNSLDA